MKITCTEALSPFLTTGNVNNHFPRFFVVHFEDAPKPLLQVSPLLVVKVLQGPLGAKYEARKQFTGEFLVEVYENYQATASMYLETIQDFNVAVLAYRTLNTIRGLISQDDLIDCREEEIVGFQSQVAVASKRITIRREGEERPTRHIVLTFERHTFAF